ncbi:DUF982 domain-containing protein [Mesorhizobium sp. WSM3862]|uniref:DUF982 domain-containing protein n=1 Tax=Mesorhizobium sp. WSM3862 TaxID=632858 RepID=UPI000BAF124F|nr:DUF982 domain-containing protein [Mesorhizobium sp. WSM3862]PBB99554.1 hypothetical protein CK224_08470 [Mesorhizobium sp. WSM3862]
MAGKNFRVPVVVYIAGLIGFALIESVAQATDFLFDHWPGNDSPAWTDAMKCCAEDSAAETRVRHSLPRLRVRGSATIARLRYTELGDTGCALFSRARWPDCGSKSQQLLSEITISAYGEFKWR